MLTSFYAIIKDSNVDNSEYWICEATAGTEDEIGRPYQIIVGGASDYSKAYYDGRSMGSHDNVVQKETGDKVGAQIFYLTRKRHLAKKKSYEKTRRTPHK